MPPRPAYKIKPMSLEMKMALLDTAPSGGVASALESITAEAERGPFAYRIRDWPKSTNIEIQTPEQQKAAEKAFWNTHNVPNRSGKGDKAK